MASELTVQTLKGPTSGANANKIIVPAGHTLAAAGHVVQQYLWLLPTGSISPAISGYTVAPTSLNTTLYATHTVTPKAADSTFIFELVAGVDASISSSGAEFVSLFQGTTLLGTSYWYRIRAGAEPYTHSLKGSYINSGSGSFSVDIRMKHQTSGIVLSVNRFNTGDTSNAQSSYLKVTEIAG